MRNNCVLITLEIMVLGKTLEKMVLMLINGTKIFTLDKLSELLELGVEDAGQCSG